MSEPPLVVGIGASADGLAAFKTFLRHTPSNTGMAFVLVQHLDPHHKSLLVELLGAQSPIPVVAATNGLAIKPNCVFVIPPDATLTIKGGILHVVTLAPAREYRRPIDTFFTSLAEDRGERAVGIVLAGVGSDGTNGIKIIKELGGLTLAQAERDTTAMQGMPSSAVATGLVDHVVPVEAMPAQLIEHQKHITAVAEKKDGDGYRKDLQEHIGSITSLLHHRSEHDFSGYKETTVLRRIQRRMQVLKIDNALGYIERLKTDQGEVEALFRELLIGVTQFFRDPQASKRSRGWRSNEAWPCLASCRHRTRTAAVPSSSIALRAKLTGHCGSRRCEPASSRDGCEVVPSASPAMRPRGAIAPPLSLRGRSNCGAGNIGATIREHPNKADNYKDRGEIAGDQKAKQPRTLEPSHLHTLRFARKISLMRRHLFAWQVIDAQHRDELRSGSLHAGYQRCR